MKNTNLHLLGKKIGMSQLFLDDGKLIPVTVIQAGPCTITQIKTLENDGYNSLQIAFSEQKKERLSRPLLGHLKKSNTPPMAHFYEFKVNDLQNFKLGQQLNVADFQEGEIVDVRGKTKGRGFQGVVKRWNFSGGPATHGHMSHRRGGSYGNCQFPGEVAKGKRMPGHMGDKYRTIQNLKVIKIIPEKNIILVKGSIPGANNSLICLSKAVKAKKNPANA